MKEPAPKFDVSGEQLSRVRHLCMALPGTMEKLSHGAPNFFVEKKGVYACFADNVHGDGHVAVWMAAEIGVQEALIRSAPKKYFRPPYVGVAGWIGVELGAVDDEELGGLLVDSWRIIMAKNAAKNAAKKKKK